MSSVSPSRLRHSSLPQTCSLTHSREVFISQPCWNHSSDPNNLCPAKASGKILSSSYLTFQHLMQMITLAFQKKKIFFFLHLASGMLHTSVFFLSLLCRAHVLFVRKPLRVLVPPCLNLLSLSFPRWSYPVPWLEFLSGWPPNFYLQFLHLPWASNLYIQLLL